MGPFSGRRVKAGRTCGRGRTCTENYGGSAVYGCSKDGVLKMKSKLLIGLFLSLLARAEPSSPAAQTNENPEARLKGAAKALIVSGFSQDDLQVLFDYSRKTSSVPFLRSRAMAIYALASLANGDTNLF